MISCSIDLSNECNLACRFCISKKYLKKGEFLPANTAYDLFEDLDQMGVKSIVFSGGGEPLLHPHFDDIITAANSAFKIGLFTNGLELYNHIDVLKRFTFIKISLDAGSKESYKIIKGKDKFNQVIENAFLAQTYTNVTIGYVLQPENISELPLIQNLFSGKCFVAVKNDVRTVPRMPTAESCAQSTKLGVITADGNVWYCSSTRWQDFYKLGNINEESIKAIIKKREMKNVDFKRCKDCRYSINKKHFDFV